MSLRLRLNHIFNVFLSSIEEPFSSESFDDGITCQFSGVLENNAASSSLQTIDLLLVLMTTAMPGEVTVLQKREHYRFIQTISRFIC